MPLMMEVKPQIDLFSAWSSIEHLRMLGVGSIAFVSWVVLSAPLLKSLYLYIRDIRDDKTWSAFDTNFSCKSVDKRRTTHNPLS